MRGNIKRFNVSRRYDHYTNSEIGVSLLCLSCHAAFPLCRIGLLRMDWSCRKSYKSKCFSPCSSLLSYQSQIFRDISSSHIDSNPLRFFEHQPVTMQIIATFLAVVATTASVAAANPFASPFTHSVTLFNGDEGRNVTWYGIDETSLIDRGSPSGFDCKGSSKCKGLSVQQCDNAKNEVEPSQIYGTTGG